jgi:Protein of unknown function (DUF3515)
MMSKQRLGGLGVLVAAILTTLTGCTPIVAMTPAADAANPACADVIVRLPPSIDDAAIRETDAQATAAWGEPSAVLLHCGVTVPGPSTLLCATVRGVDWLRDDSDAPNYVFTTYGRDPAVEVVVNGDVLSGTNALIELASAVAAIEPTRQCTNPDDVLGEATPSPSPSPTG